MDEIDDFLAQKKDEYDLNLPSGDEDEYDDEDEDKDDQGTLHQ